MFVIEVIPIKRGFGKESFSYFSAAKIAPGNVVKVSLRGKDVWGIVAKVSRASAQKAELKTSSFALKKITSSSKIFFDKWWIAAIEKVALYFAATMGSVMSVFTPVAVLENIQKFARPILAKQIQKKITIKSEILCTQTEDEERWNYYRSAIREEFAKRHSVFLCLPTLENIKTAVTRFEKGIEKYTYVFHSGKTKTELIQRWNECTSEEHPVLIIATASWLLIPRSDLGTIILDKENSQEWKTLSRPYIDIRKTMEFFAEERGVRLIFGDSMLRIETIWRYKNDEIFSFEPVKFRLSSPTESQLIEMKSVNSHQRKGFKAVSSELVLLIKRAKRENKNIFIYATRKGLSSVTVCNDCGEEVLCHNCFSPVVLYKSSTSLNIFRCHQCSSIRSAKELCKKCGSWRLISLGVGIEKVVEEILELTGKEISPAEPKINILQISSDSTTQAKASQIAEKFYKTPGSILVGTEMALHYLKNPVNFTAVASIDSLFSVPDFKIREKIFHLILKMKLLAREKYLVQIRNVERNTIELALSGNILDFYKMEIKERELLQYPPFSVFIKIIIRDNRPLAEEGSKYLLRFFKEWNPIVFESLFERRDTKVAFNCVIKIPRDNWPNTELLQKIFSLPPQFEIKVDPNNLL